jgi:hypothetical protein
MTVRVRFIDAMFVVLSRRCLGLFPFCTLPFCLFCTLPFCPFCIIQLLRIVCFNEKKINSAQIKKNARNYAMLLESAPAIALSISLTHSADTSGSRRGEPVANKVDPTQTDRTR